MAVLEMLLRDTGFGKRKDALDHNTNPALVNQASDLGQVSPVRLGHVADAPHAILRRFVLRGLAQGRNQNAALLQGRP
jgi:hypothetical protein